LVKKYAFLFYFLGSNLGIVVWKTFIKISLNISCRCEVASLKLYKERIYFWQIYNLKINREDPYNKKAIIHVVALLYYACIVIA